MTIKAQIETGSSKTCSYFMDEEGDVQQDRSRNKLNTAPPKILISPLFCAKCEALIPAEIQTQLNKQEVENNGIQRNQP